MKKGYPGYGCVGIAEGRGKDGVTLRFKDGTLATIPAYALERRVSAS